MSSKNNKQLLVMVILHTVCPVKQLQGQWDYDEV